MLIKSTSAFGFDLDKLGIWPDAVARYAMTERAGVNLSNRTGSYVPYQSIFGQGQNVRFNEITVEKFLDEKKVAGCTSTTRRCRC